MIWINVWDRVLCRWVRRLVSSGAAKAMPHIVAGAIFSCGPVTAHQPPIPVIPIPLISTPPEYIPTIPIWPVPQIEQPRWTFIPSELPQIAEGGGISSGSGFNQGGALDVGAFSSPALDSDLRKLDHFSEHHSIPVTPICDDTPPIDDKPPVSKVDAPGPLAWFFLVCVLLFIWKALPLQASKASYAEE